MRKLAIACGAFSAAVFLAQFVLPASWLFPLALALVLPGIALVLLKRRWLLPVIISLCALAAGFYAYGMHNMLTIERAHELDGQELYTSARVLAAPASGDGWTRAEIALRIDERTELKALAIDYDGRLENIRPGDQFKARFSLRAADTRYGERYDSNPARGVYLIAYTRSRLYQTGHRFTVRGFASSLNAKLCERIRSVFPEGTSSFFQALMLGEKADLYEDDVLYLSLSRAGLMHMVAVSGVKHLLSGFYRTAKKPVNWALFGHRPRRCTPKLRFT